MVKNKSQFALSPTNLSFRTARYSTTNTQKTLQLKSNTVLTIERLLLWWALRITWFTIFSYTLVSSMLSLVCFTKIYYFSIRFTYFFMYQQFGIILLYGFMCSLLVRQLVKLNFYLNLVNFKPGQKQIRLKLIFPEFVKISRIVILCGSDGSKCSVYKISILLHPMQLIMGPRCPRT